jgi:uncharacterized membrane protein (UPF0127 family)
MQSKINFFKKYKLVLILLSLICFFVYALAFHVKKPDSLAINIGQNTIRAKVADTEHLRSMGLSYTEKIDDNVGMLFVFDDVSTKNFWMRGMYFNIDIIWIDENKQVVGFFENVSKDTFNQKNPEQSKIFRSPVNTKYVLEVNAGTIEKLKIKTGDNLDFSY